MISDIEETLSVLSRNSRSTTPASRTPTPSFGQINYFGGDTGDNSSVADKHIIPIVTVFDDLKDYLSDSDLSLEYQIARQRRRQKNMKNLNKQKAQLSNILTSKNKLMGQQERVKLPDEEKNTRDEAKEDKFLSEDRNNPFKSPSCSNIFQNAFESQETSLSSKIVVNKKNAETVKNDKNYVNTTKLANEHELGSHKAPLLKNKQGNDFAVRKINSENARSGGGSRGHCAASAPEPDLERQHHGAGSRSGELTEHVNYNTNSLQRRKQIKTASLGNMMEHYEPSNGNSPGKIRPTDSNMNLKHDSKGFATSFTDVFSEVPNSQPKFAEKRLVADYTGSTGSGRPHHSASPGCVPEVELLRQYMGLGDTKPEPGYRQYFQNLREEMTELSLRLMHPNTEYLTFMTS